MNTPAAQLSTNVPEHEVPRAARPLEARPSQPPQGGRFWFVFDRWLAAPDVVSPDDEFVMA